VSGWNPGALTIRVLRPGTMPIVHWSKKATPLLPVRALGTDTLPPPSTVNETSSPVTG
jgi:hypothetical protein